MEKSTFAFIARSSSPDLKFSAKFNHEIIFEGFLTTEFQTFAHIFDDSIEGVNVVEFEMSGKNHSHTDIDHDGNIVSDQAIEISTITVDGIVLDNLVTTNAVYSHDFNGSGTTVSDEFYNIMGCNGIVRFEFNSPSYIWLLENM